MKKGLSVLLIVAALFGFYGGASSLTDVLACKDYWEKEGEKSTADMNKLEDGLNQLGENEQAYLDGVQQLAEAEPKLAEGKATLAEKEAEFAAAPGKLAAGKAAVAKGESDLSKLGTLIGGVKAVLKAYPTFREGYEQLKAGREGVLTKESLEKTAALAPLVSKLLKDNPTAAGQLDNAITVLKKQAASIGYTNDDYDEFRGGLSDMVSALTAAQPVLSGYADTVNGLVSQASEAKAAAERLKAGKGTAEDQATVIGYAKERVKATDATVITIKAVLRAFDMSTDKVDEAVAAMGSNDPTYIVGGVLGFCQILDGASSTIADYEKQLAGKISDAKLWIGGYDQLQEKRTDTKEGLPYLAGGVAQIIGGVYDSGNKELISGMNKAAKAFGFNAHDFAPVATSKLTKDLASGSWLENFYNDGNKIEKAFKAVLPKLTKKYSSGSKELAAGKRTLKQGLADYAAAPGKLADGRQQLADAEKQLADGKKQLAQYEDGEQQVRDGLATLMSTEPNGGLESILDRRGGDDQFDDANGHLDISEGLDAVKVGRGYQADSGELITKEITNRAVGTAAGLGAAVLACLAALLSLIKKYKGAAVTAVLAAIAGVAGAVVGNGAGSEFSNIAGSTVGSLPWIAAGVVAAVACVFAIVNFTAKAE